MSFTMDNKIRVIFNRTENPTVSLVVMINSGSIHEAPNAYGETHGLEHNLRRKPKAFAHRADFVRHLDKYCTKFDAATGKMNLVLYFETDSRNIRTVIKTAASTLKEPDMSLHQVDPEKNRISEERREADDDHEWWIREEIDRLMFSPPFAHTIDGTLTTIERITPASLRNLRRRIVVGQRLTIIVTGRFNLELVGQTIRSEFDSLPRGKPAPSVPSPVRPGRGKIRVRTDPGLKLVYYTLGFLIPPLDEQDFYALHIIRNYLSGRNSSLVKLNVDDEGLGYSSGDFLEFYRDIAQYGIIVSLHPSKLIASLQILAKEIAALRTTLISPELLELSQGNIGRQTRRFFRSSLKASLFQADALAQTSRFISTREFTSGINRVPRQRIRRLAKRIFLPGRLSGVFIGPMDGITKAAVRKALRFKRQR